MLNPIFVHRLLDPAATRHTLERTFDEMIAADSEGISVVDGINALLSCHSSEAHVVGVQKATTCGTATNVPFLEFFIERLSNDEPFELQLRAHALRAMVIIAGVDAVPFLRKQLESPHESWSRIVVRATLELPREVAVAQCRALVDAEMDEVVQREAVWCLAMLDVPYKWQLLLDDLDSEPSLTFFETLCVLSKLKVPKALGKMNDLLTRLDKLGEVERNRFLVSLCGILAFDQATVQEVFDSALKWVTSEVRKQGSDPAGTRNGDGSS